MCVLRGRATFSRESRLTAGRCSHGTRRQVRVSVRGWFVAVIF